MVLAGSALLSHKVVIELLKLIKTRNSCMLLNQFVRIQKIRRTLVFTPRIFLLTSLKTKYSHFSNSLEILHSTNLVVKESLLPSSATTLKIRAKKLKSKVDNVLIWQLRLCMGQL